MLLWKFSYLKVEVWFFNDCGGQSTLSDDNPGKLLLFLFYGCAPTHMENLYNIPCWGLSR